MIHFDDSADRPDAVHVDDTEEKKPAIRAVCTRVHLDGIDVDIHAFTTDDVEGFKAYNAFFRPSCALFVNGDCVAQGHHSAEACERFSREIKRRIR